MMSPPKTSLYRPRARRSGYSKANPRRRLRVEPLEARRLLICTVTSTEDPSEPGETTLRDCVDSGEMEIGFDLPAGNQTVNVEEPIVVDEQIIIRGMLNRPTEIDLRTRVAISGVSTSGSTGRIFEVRPTGDLTLNHLTLRDGDAESTFMSGYGGAILNEGRLTINNSTLHSNTAFVGGAIFSTNEKLSIFQSTLSGNSALTLGGAIAVGPTIDPVSFSIGRSTITDNVSFGSAGGLGLGIGVAAEIRNSIVSGNAASFAPDVLNSASADVGFSIFGSREGFEYFSSYGPVPFTLPELTPLSDNGGETDTHLPTVSSPVIDAADGTITSGKDQRGAARAVCITDGGCDGGGADIGAVERGSDLRFEPDCDFDDDSVCDCDDIDALVADVAAGGTTLMLDLNVDGLVNTLDVELWLQEAGTINIGRSYLPGDANLDGFVDGFDFFIWNANKFSISATGWCKGDFNASGTIDGADFFVWKTYKFQTAPPLPRSRPFVESNSLLPILHHQLPAEGALRNGNVPSPHGSQRTMVSLLPNDVHHKRNKVDVISTVDHLFSKFYSDSL